MKPCKWHISEERVERVVDDLETYFFLKFVTAVRVVFFNSSRTDPLRRGVGLFVNILVLFQSNVSCIHSMCPNTSWLK